MTTADDRRAEDRARARTHIEAIRAKLRELGADKSRAGRGKPDPRQPRRKPTDAELRALARWQRREDDT